MMLLNFTTRGAIAVYETQGSQILLDDYGLSQLQLGAVVTSAGCHLSVTVILFPYYLHSSGLATSLSSGS